MSNVRHCYHMSCTPTSNTSIWLIFPKNAKDQNLRSQSLIKHCKNSAIRWTYRSSTKN